MDYLNIGSTPPEEDCLPAGHPKARAETQVYCEQLQREFPKANFRVKAFPHDFGTYHEVVAWWAEGDDAAREAAFEAEAGGAGYWDEEAKESLKILGIRWVNPQGIGG